MVGIEHLLLAGAKINVQDVDGNTALVLAVKHKKKKVPYLFCVLIVTSYTIQYTIFSDTGISTL